MGHALRRQAERLLEDYRGNLEAIRDITYVYIIAPLFVSYFHAVTTPPFISDAKGMIEAEGVEAFLL